jgi:hypothetical protein
MEQIWSRTETCLREMKSGERWGLAPMIADLGGSTRSSEGINGGQRIIKAPRTYRKGTTDQANRGSENKLWGIRSRSEPQESWRVWPSVRRRRRCGTQEDEAHPDGSGGRWRLRRCSICILSWKLPFIFSGGKGLRLTALFAEGDEGQLQITYEMWGVESGNA